MDEEEIIRDILFNHIHEVLRRNAHLLDIRGDGEISLENRIGLSLDKDLLSFIRRKIENNTEVFDIDSSILTHSTHFFRSFALRGLCKHIED